MKQLFLVFKKSFIKDVKENGTDYSFVEILTEILSGSRDMTRMVDEEGAKKDAKTMYNVCRLTCVNAWYILKAKLFLVAHFN